MVKFPLRLFIDSGAFSAYKKGHVVNVDEYIEFLLNHPEITSAVSLDIIPGTPGRPRTQAQVEYAAIQGWKHYRKMCKAGLDPIPVYHLGEQQHHLERLLGSGATYIGLGGVANVEDSVRMKWLDSVFGLLCGNKGYPQVKVHGFGITSASMVMRYPWASTDSVSWRMYASYGFCPIPVLNADGTANFGVSPWMIGISKGGSKSGKVHKSHLAGNHFDVLGKSVQKRVLSYLESEGFELEELYTDDNARTRVALRFYKRMVEEKRRSNQPFFYRSSGLHCKSSTRGRDTSICEFNMLFTIAGSGKLSDLLNQEGLRNRLLSYEYFRNGKEPFDIEHYMNTGKTVNRKKLGN